MLTSSLVLALLLGASPSEVCDDILAKAQAEADVQVSPRCSDDAFLRRVTLDLAGRIPTREELKAFRDSPDRAAMIDKLLASDEFSRFWSQVWTASLVGYATREFNVSREPLRVWLEHQLREGVPYDRMVRTLIAAEGDSAFSGPVNFLLRHREEPAVKVSRMFLGVRLDCARCHDHPFAKWTREDYNRFSAFFESVEYRQVSERNIRLVESPRNAERKERPRFLTGAQPRTSRWRDELALFVTTCKPFARNFANRIWYQLLGRGIVDPPDDFSASQPSSRELLEHLTDYARTSEFDVRGMVRVICNSQAYQRSSGAGAVSLQSRELFCSYPPKPLTAEQLVQSLPIALDLRWTDVERAEQLQRFTRGDLDEDYSQTWDYRETVQDVMRELVQQAPLRATSTTSIFERILSRRPTEREIALCRDRPRSQVIFALIHGNEFRFNH